MEQTSDEMDGHLVNEDKCARAPDAGAAMHQQWRKETSGSRREPCSPSLSYVQEHGDEAICGTGDVGSMQWHIMVGPGGKPEMVNCSLLLGRYFQDRKS